MPPSTGVDCSPCPSLSSSSSPPAEASSSPPLSSSPSSSPTPLASPTAPSSSLSAVLGFSPASFGFSRPSSSSSLPASSPWPSTKPQCPSASSSPPPAECRPPHCDLRTYTTTSAASATPPVASPTPSSFSPSWSPDSAPLFTNSSRPSVAPTGKSSCVIERRRPPEEAAPPPCYLCWFLYHNDYNGFRLEELEALAQSEGGVSRAYLWRDGELTRPPSDSEAQFVYCQLPSEETAKQILKKSILIRAFIEVRPSNRQTYWSRSGVEDTSWKDNRGKKTSRRRVRRRLSTSVVCLKKRFNNASDTHEEDIQMCLCSDTCSCIHPGQCPSLRRCLYTRTSWKEWGNEASPSTSDAGRIGSRELVSGVCKIQPTCSP